MAVIDTLVVGAGPAGVAAAVELRRAGHDVVVLVDKAEFPRDKCCGDGLTTLALRELEHLGFDPATVPTSGPSTVPCCVLRLVAPLKVPLPAGEGIYAAVAPRLELDAALVRLAVDAGVDVRLGHGVKTAAIADDGDRHGRRRRLGDVIARHVVAADGMWSPTRKALGISGDGYLGEWHAIRQYVVGVTGPAGDELIVWFDDDLLPGYAWSFPLPDGRANVGFGVLRDGSRTGKDVQAVCGRACSIDHTSSQRPRAGRDTGGPAPGLADPGADRSCPLAHGPVLFAATPRRRPT